MNLLCTKFQLSNPYRFRKIALERRTDTKWRLYSCTPATKNKNLKKKSFSRPLDGSMNLLCTKFQLSNPYRFRKIALDGRTDTKWRLYSCTPATKKSRAPRNLSKLEAKGLEWLKKNVFDEKIVCVRLIKVVQCW